MKRLTIVVVLASLLLAAACNRKGKKETTAMDSSVENVAETDAATAKGLISLLEGEALMPALSDSAAATDAAATDAAARAARKGGKQSSITDKIRIVRVQSYKLRGLSSLDAVVVVSSTLNRDLLVESLSATLRSSGSVAVKAVSDTPLVIPKRATTGIEVSVSLQISNPLTLLALAMKLRSGDTKNMTVDIAAKVSSGAMSRTIELNDIPLQTLLSATGVSSESIGNLLK